MTDAEKFEAYLPDWLEKEAPAEMTFEDRHKVDQARQTASITFNYEQEQKRKRCLGWRQVLKEKYRDKGPWNW